MATIFISYRRADSTTISGRIYDHLRSEFGKDAIFKDVDNITAGSDFRGVLHEATAHCKVMLVIIGPKWLNIDDGQGKRRLDNANDFVRIEVETGLQRDSAIVIPLLVSGAGMPSANDLPDPLKELAFKNALWMRDDPDFHRDMDRLIAAIRPLVEAPTPPPMPTAPKPIRPKREKTNPTVVVAVITGIFALLAAIIGIVPPLLQQGRDAAATEAVLQTVVAETRAAVLPTTQVTATDTPTLSGFQQLETAQAQLTQSSGTQAALALTSTEEFISSINITSTAVQFGITETAAFATLFALSATPTMTPTPSDTPISSTATFTPTQISSLTPDPLDEALSRARAGVSSNAAWQALYPQGFVQEFDDVPMVLVPAGCFTIGRENGEYDEKNGNEICFDVPFWLDQTEVTQANFVRLGGTQANPNAFTGDNRPVERITWFEAQAFCEKRGGRLPTEAEWEYATRGPDDLVYPWGNDWNENNVVWSGNSNDQTAPVGSYPSGVAWVGALDLIGNVWEWTLSEYKDYPYNKEDGRETNLTSTSVQRVLRRGWYYYDSGDLRASDRYGYGPNYGYYGRGFRCARSDIASPAAVQQSSPADAMTDANDVMSDVNDVMEEVGTVQAILDSIPGR